MSYDVIVLGTGGMGSAAAYHLARRGQRVLGLDRFGPAHDRGSSHGGSRVYRQSYFEDPAYVPLLLRAWDLWHQLAADSGRDVFAHRRAVRRPAGRPHVRRQPAGRAGSGACRTRCWTRPRWPAGSRPSGRPPTSWRCGGPGRLRPAGADRRRAAGAGRRGRRGPALRRAGADWTAGPAAGCGCGPPQGRTPPARWWSPRAPGRPSCWPTGRAAGGGAAGDALVAPVGGIDPVRTAPGLHLRRRPAGRCTASRRSTGRPAG